MTRQNKINQVHAQVVDRLEDLKVRLDDAKTSPMSSRLFANDAKELVGEALLLMVLLNLDEAEPAETCVFEWTEDSKDFWKTEIGDYTLTVWDADDYWSYEVWDGLGDPDEPVRQGRAKSFDAGCKAAEKAMVEFEECRAQERESDGQGEGNGGQGGLD